MANYERGKQKAAYPIPLSLFPMTHCLVTVLQRYRDGVCSLLFPPFFIICHPYIPLHFEEMIFTLVSPIFAALKLQSMGATPPEKNSAIYNRAICWRAQWPCGQSGRGAIENGVVHLLCRAGDFLWRRAMRRIAIAWRRCTPLTIVDVLFGMN